jgi:hypothetical protein
VDAMLPPPPFRFAASDAFTSRLSSDQAKCHARMDDLVQGKQDHRNQNPHILHNRSQIAAICLNFEKANRCHGNVYFVVTSSAGMQNAVVMLEKANDWRCAVVGQTHVGWRW